MPAPCITTSLNTAINSACQRQIGGIEPLAKLIPWSILNKSTLVITADTCIVTTLELTSAGGAMDVTVKGRMPYSDTVINGTEGTYVSLFESVFAFPIHQNTPASAKQIMQLGNDEYVAVVQFKGGTAAEGNEYGIIGLTRGLRLRAANFSNASQDEFGWKIEMAEEEGLVPIMFYGGAAPKTWFDAL